MERNVRHSLFETTGSDSDPTPLEIQRWEDDGGAVLPDVMPSRKWSLQRRAIDDFQFDRELVAAE